ncbi:MAG TPA: fibronectin type III domain-containing protein, partial [Candidatus Marinimicrobia bacterium]|nr:fibronectin type III domain-containing protein [Candidatus Neomarinimicrobiota bacterium]
ELWGIKLADPKPTIASITSTTSDGTYKIGDAINITVNFSEAVTLSSSGSLTVTLETGTTDRTVSISSISNATSASGTYTVQSGDLSSDLTANSVSVSGSLSDASSQAMDSFTIGSNLAGSSALVIDGVLPTIASVKSTSDNATYSADSKINITVNFSEAVSISDTSGTLTVTLEMVGDTTGRDVTITDISSTTAAKGTYTVQSGDASDDLDVKTIKLSSGATLKDAAGNAMSAFTIPTDSSLADFNNIKINTTLPGTPTNIVAKNRYGGIGLKWYKESSAAKYYVYRSGDNATFEKLSTEPTDTTFIDALTAGSKYYYYVTAVNSAGTAGDTSKHVFGYATRIWWVDVTNGKDETRYGVSADSSFKTIEQAVKTNSSLVSGDTIYVKPSITSSYSTKYSGYYDFGNISGGINLDHNKDFVLKSTAGADSTILNAEGKNRHFYFDDGQTSATQIIGFTFFNGKEEGNDQDSNWEGGGSVVISGSNTKIKFENCIFDSNRVTSDSDGGAIVIRDQAVPEFTSCTFNNNFAIDTDNQRQGGAIRIRSPYSVPDLQNTINFKQCKFIGNYVQSKYSAYGGAVYTNRNTLFENCLFVKNGAISGYGSTNTNDWNESKGGAIVSNGGYDNTGVLSLISNSTFDRNYVDVRTSNGNPKATEIYYNSWSSAQASKVYVYNTIITGSYRLLNGADYTEIESDKVFSTDNQQNADNKVTADYSAIEGSAGQSWADKNVFEINPVYSDTAILDYSLSITSPLIGKGWAAKWEGIVPPTVDLLGNARPSPSGSNPDMGAYENTLASSASPLPVTSLTGTSKTNSVYLSWSAVKASLGSSTDAADIKYLVYQGDSQVGSSVSTTYTVTGLDNGTAYTFSVSAQDTSSGESGAKSKAVSITPKYRGPKWYVAASNGSAIADTSTNADLGSIGSPINHLTSAIEIASAGDTIIMQKGTHTGSNNRGIDWNASKSLVIMGDPNYTAENIIIDAGGRDRHFEFDSGEDNTYQVIGLTLYDGKSTDQGGGSVSIGNNSSPVF